VRRVALSPDEAWAAAGTEHGRVQIARLPGGDVAADVAAHTGTITALAFHPGGRRLATASAGDTKVRLWDWDGATLREAIAQRGRFFSLASPGSCHKMARSWQT
jgi:WD40 repeat protein